MADHHSIVIVGAGLGGLAAARVLQVHGLRATVLEAEPDRRSRVQGGMLDIHADSGQVAVRAAGLWEPFARLIHPGGEATRVLDHTGAVLFEHEDAGDLSRPEVDRGQLRDLLLDSLEQGTVRWGAKVASVRAASPDGRHTIELENGEHLASDLLIGADGAWSRVRPLLTDARPAYTGISFVETDIAEADRTHPEQAAVMGAGMLFALRGQVAVMGHRETDGSLHTYLGLRVPEDWVNGIAWDDVEASTRAVLARLDGWADSLRGLIREADAGLTPRRIHALPVGLRWERVPGVTLVGDAAHLMSPFAGEGANLAMHDGALLALAIAESRGDTEAALSQYEADMFSRSTASAEQTAASMEVMFRDDSPRGFVETFQQVHG